MLLLDSLFLEQFEKSGYNSVKRALSVVSYYGKYGLEYHNKLLIAL